MAEWLHLRRRTWNLEVATGSNTNVPLCTPSWSCFSVDFNSSVVLVNSQVLGLPQVGIFKPIVFICFFFCLFVCRILVHRVGFSS